MDTPSRRNRKLPRSKWSFTRIAGILIIICGGALLTFVAIQTGNYMGLAAIAVVLLFLSIGFNFANIRNFMPGLSANKQGIKFIAVFSYACLGLMLLVSASHLPRSNQSSLYEQLLLSRYVKQHVAQQQTRNPEEDISTQESNDNVLVDINVLQEQPPPTLPTVQFEQQVDSDAPAMKSDMVKANPVVTKVLNANILQVNDQQIIRLIGIKVPESLQETAIRYLNQMVLNQEVSLERCPDRPLDEHGQIRAIVSVKGENINRNLIELGYSSLIITTPCSLNIKAWSDAEELAKQKKIGIWAKHP